MSIMPILPDVERHCFIACRPGTFCKCLGEMIGQPLHPLEPKPGEKCPGCEEAIFADNRTPYGTCGWCGYDPVAKRHGGFRPA